MKNDNDSGRLSKFPHFTTHLGFSDNIEISHAEIAIIEVLLITFLITKSFYELLILSTNII